MRLEIRIIDDSEQVVAEYNGDPCQPGQWRAQVGKTIKGKMPQQSDQDNSGTYELFGFTYQPHTHVERPNGYRTPAPGPNNGQFPSPSAAFTGLPAYFHSKPLSPKLPWGPSSPTAAPAPSANNLNSRG
jgi:hypothetical protein